MATRANALLSETLLGIQEAESLPLLILSKNQNMEKNFNGQSSENSNNSDTRVSTNPKEGSEAWKTIWDFKTVSNCHHGTRKMVKETKVF